MRAAMPAAMAAYSQLSRPLITNRLDPTRTTVLRRDYVRGMTGRYKLLLNTILTALAEGKLGNGGVMSLLLLDGFIDWLNQKSDELVLEVDPQQAAEASVTWQRSFVAAAFLRGVNRADGLMKRAGYTVLPDAIIGQSIYQNEIDVLATRNFNLLKNANAEMAAQIKSTLTDGFRRGLGVDDIGDLIADRVQKVGVYRGRLIARTEIVAAHAEATLSRLSSYGVGRVGAEVEFVTSGNNCSDGASPPCVCERCAGLEGEVYTIAEARGVIPVHPGCRCGWLPVIQG